MVELNRKGLFNENGDIELNKRRMINGNTTNLNDFNNIKYNWTSDWYRQAMNNFWIPEEINLTQDIKDYRKLDEYERLAYDKALSFLIFLDSIQTANLPNIGDYITANEVNLCLTIQAFQEAVHSQSYGYILDTICSPEERSDILYQWKEDKNLLERNKFIGNLYNEFLDNKSKLSLMKTMIANYILENNLSTFEVREKAADILNHIAFYINRFYAQRLIESLIKKGIEPMLEEILIEH